MKQRRHPPPPLLYGSVCSGIEAVSLAWQPLGMQPAWVSEIDPFPCAVLAHHHPHVPNLGDMTGIARQVRAGTVAAPDILVGGTPCQTFSVAGSRLGLSDPRGALTLSYVELANAIDQTRVKTNLPPAALVWENVPGVLSDRGNAFGCFLGALAGERRALEPPGKKWTHAGYIVGPRRRIAWRLLDAQRFGLAQRRKRVFLVASGRDDLDPADILFESEGVLGNPASCRAPWQDAAAAPASRAVPASGFPGLKPAYGKVTICFGGGNTRGPIDVAACLVAAPGSKHDFEVETFTVQSVAGSISHTLGAANGGRGSSEDGTGRGVPIAVAYTPQAVAFGENARGEVRLESGHGHVAGTLSTGGGKAGQGTPVIVTTLPADAAVSPTLRAFSGAGDAGCLLMPDYEAHYIAEPPGDSDWMRWTRWRVRRLMPVECERLQGMPDNYTLVPYRGRPAADSPRYKAIGNSMAVPCVAWLGQRLLHALNRTNPMQRPA